MLALRAWEGGLRTDAEAGVKAGGADSSKGGSCGADCIRVFDRAALSSLAALGDEPGSPHFSDREAEVLSSWCRSSSSRNFSQTLPASGAWGSGGGRGRGGAKEEHRRVQLLSRRADLEAQRQHDQARIAEKVQRRKELREGRSKRLLDSLGPHAVASVSAETAVELRRHAAEEEERLRGLHAAREESVFQPLSSQLAEHFDASCRAEQQALSGTKSVGFQMPGEVFKLQAGCLEDPVSLELRDAAWEKAFDREATAVIQGACGTLHATLPGSPKDGRACVQQPRARSRPVLEPARWDPVRLEATRYGRFARSVQGDPCFRESKKGLSGTPSIFVPDESDGVPAAGKRTVRVGPRAVAHGSAGALAGSLAARGEAAHWKSPAGASSGAPAQDHYAYAVGAPVADMEFPLGKRLFRQLH